MAKVQQIGNQIYWKQVVVCLALSIKICRVQPAFTPKYMSLGGVGYFKTNTKLVINNYKTHT